MVLSICLETNPVRQVPAFLERLARNADGYTPIVRGVWLVFTDHGPQTWTDWLKPFLGPRDSLIILEVANNFGGMASQPIWDWLNDAVATGAMAVSHDPFAQ